MAGFDIAPYGQAISSVSDLLTGVMKRIWPEKASEIDRLRVEQATTEFILTQEGQKAMAEFADSASARQLAEAAFPMARTDAAQLIWFKSS